MEETAVLHFLPTRWFARSMHFSYADFGVVRVIGEFWRISVHRYGASRRVRAKRVVRLAGSERFNSGQAKLGVRRLFAAMEEPWSLRQPKRLRCRAVALLLYFLILLQLAPPFASGNTTYEDYDPWELDALQDLRQAWEATPEMEVNLPGWSSVVQTPCNNYFDAYANESNWQGVQCAYFVVNDTDFLQIVELNIRDSNIVGTLPEIFINLTSLCNLEISGNRNLTGELPFSLNGNFISTLDLHGNGFHGNVTPPLDGLFNLLKIDFSDNNFSGPFPHNSTQLMTSLGLLNLAENKFDGQVPYEALETKPVLQRLDLSKNHFSGSMELNFTGAKSLRYLNISSNMFNGSLPNLTAISKLRHVNFSDNSFEGTNVNLSSIFNSECLAHSLSILDISHTSVQVDLYAYLGNLHEIYLDNSTLNGTLDISRMVQLGILSTKTNTTPLQILSLRDNNIQHVIHDQSAITEVSTQLRLQGNPYCNTTNGNDGTRCFCNQTCLDTEKFVEGRRANKRVIIATTSASSGVVLLLFIAMAILYHRSKRYKEYLLAQFEEKFQQFDIKPTIFSYNDIRLATKDFHAGLRLGAGAYGAVYKGEFLNKSDKSVFAVKRLLILPSQGIDSFLNEVVLITGMRHRNLVALKGCCLRDKERLLVYEYINNGDVEQLLFGEKRAFVDWQTRFKICIGVANGLHYLHDLANPRIIHRDIKAANILLDANFEAKIADFGLALLFPDGTNHIETVTIAGTRGYLAPEYASRGQLSDKADVYSFGILCLEIVSGRRNIVPTSSADQVYILEWARQLQRDGNAMALLDRTVDQLSDVEQDEMRRVIHVALQCTHSEAAPRPTMANVVAMLLGQSVTETMTPAMSPAMSVFNTDIFEEDPEFSEFSQTQSELVALNSFTAKSSSSHSVR